MLTIHRVLVGAAATAALVTATAAGAQAAITDSTGPRGGVSGSTASAPAVTATSGAFRYEMTATAGTIHDVEVFGDIRDGRGSGSRPAVRPDEIRSMGYVAGGTSFVNGVSGSHLSGVAGRDVTAVTVVTATGARIPATVAHGLWAAAWQGDPDSDGGRATVRFTTVDGHRHTVTTDDIDWIAAAQRAAG